MTLGRCYKATVNESETINEAKALLGWFPAAGEARGPPTLGSPAALFIERS